MLYYRFGIRTAEDKRDRYWQAEYRQFIVEATSNSSLPFLEQSF